MPHLTMGLSPIGPMIDVWIGASVPRASALKAAGRTPELPKQVRALVDTGASCTAVDPSIIKSLGLIPTGTTYIQTPSTGAAPHLANQYDVLLGVTYQHAPEVLIFEALPVIESALIQQGFHVLLGRDVLGKCLFIYNGQEAYFSLAF